MSEAWMLRKLWLKSFRGWVGQQELDLDAELLLICAPNGQGKTSLLDAMGLLLNNHSSYSSPAGLEGREPVELGSFGEPWSLQAELVPIGGGAQEDPPIARLERGQDGRQDAWWGVVRSRLALPDGSAPMELLARITTLFAGLLRELLDDGRQGLNLDRWWLAEERELEELRKRRELLEQELQREAQRWEERAEALRKAEEELRKAWAPLRSSPAWGDPPLGEAGLGPAEMEGALLSRLGRLSDRGAADSEGLRGLRGRRLAEELLGALKQSLLTEAGAQALQREREQLRRAIEEGQQSRRLLDWVQPPATEAEPHPVGLDRLLEALRKQRGRWLEEGRQLGRPELEPVLKELARLDEGTLAARSADLRAALEPARELEQNQARLAQVEAELARLSQLPPGFEAELLSFGKQAQLLQVREDELRMRPDPDQLARQQRALAALKGVLDELWKRPPELTALIETTLNQGLMRVPGRPGSLPLAAERVLDQAQRPSRLLRSADGLHWAQSSAGQQTLLALAFALAQAEALREQLPHRVLILDDCLSDLYHHGLLALATWLRQLAYHPEPARRWQVIIATHHEEQLRQLRELLDPPQGRRLRTLRLREWSPETGPTLDWEPEEAALEGSLEASELAQALQRHFEQAWIAPSLETE